MLIVSGRGQVLVLDEPERYIAGERWRDDWTVTVVSAAARSSTRVFWFGCSAVVGVAGLLRGHAWLHAELGGRGQGLVLDEAERYRAGERRRDERARGARRSQHAPVRRRQYLAVSFAAFAAAEQYVDFVSSTVAPFEPHAPIPR